MGEHERTTNGWLNVDATDTYDFRLVHSCKVIVVGRTLFDSITSTAREPFCSTPRCF